MELDNADDLGKQLDDEATGLQTDLDTVQQGVKDKLKADQDLINDLEAQLASRAGDVPRAQVEAVLTKLRASRADLKTTLDNSTTTDSSTDGSTGNGETPVPVGGNPG